MRRPFHRLRRFGRSEDGSMIVFGLFIFVMMLIVAGMSVDIMRFESTRTRLQATCDRAVLAAADLDQARDAEAVVRDYFQSAGLLGELNSVAVTETFNSRRVTANADLGIDTHFMSLAGVDELVAPGDCTAEESVQDIEIVLVLDVSGSMVRDGNGNPVQRLANLRTAARDFVQTVLEDDTEHRISIAIVPFNGQVNLGPGPTVVGQETLSSWYRGITDRVPDLYENPAYRHIGCVDLPSTGPGSVYLTQTIARDLPMPATAMADTFTSADLSNAYRHYFATWNSSPDRRHGLPIATNMWCPAAGYTGTSTAGNVVLLPSRSISTLQGRIDGLVGVGATSINAGMRWGMTLLDPNSQPMFEALGVNLAGRPYAYGQENTLKVIVLMTDGENFPEERVKREFRSSPPNTFSPIFRANRPLADGSFYYSIFHEAKVNRRSASTISASKPFWVPHLGQWHARPWNGTSPVGDPSYVDDRNLWREDKDGDGDCDNQDERGRGALKDNEVCLGYVSQQTWPQVWSSLRMSWVAWQLYVRAGVLSSNATASVSQASQRAQMDLFRTVTDAPGTVPASSPTPTPTMDGQLDQMCDRARDGGVVVYGIAFEVPTARGKDAIFNCASSPSHYYDAQNRAGILAAFQAIAAQINALRLTN